MKKLLVLVIALFLLSGCASIMSGRSQKITVQADPPDARITIDGAVHHSPCQPEVNRMAKHNIVVEKPGYKPCQFTPGRTMNGWVLGNILLGGIIGIIVDLATGSVASISDDEVRMVLVPGKDCQIYANGQLVQRDGQAVNNGGSKKEEMDPDRRGPPLKQETPDSKTKITETKAEPERRKVEVKVADSGNVLQPKTEFAQPKEQVKGTDPGRMESLLETKVLDTTKPDPPAQSGINTSRGRFTAIEQKKGAPEAKATEIKKTYSNVDEAKVCRNRGLAFIQNKQFDTAIQEFTKAINLEPKNGMAYYNRGWIFYSKGEYERAIQDFNAAIAINPNNSDSYYNRGLCYNMKLQKDKAKYDFQMACDLGDQAGCRKVK
jgi:TolA-binding protein